MAWRLPAARDRVRLAGLTALELNGKTGHVVMFHSDKGRYEVSVEGCPGTKAIKRANLELLGAGAPGAAKPPRVHVLIPCHIESDRRLVTCIRCVRSVGSQHPPGGFSVFVGLSGPEEYRAQGTDFLALLAVQTPHIRWNLLDDGVENRAQFEHLRHLLALSDQESESAWLMFLDNDDMFHPQRVNLFKDIIEDPDRPPGPFSVPCKLLLDESVRHDEGTMERLIAHEADFDKWKRDGALRNKLSVASADNVGALDAEEFFDFCVPASVLREFMELTPVEVTKSSWCDLRFLKMLEHLSVVEPMDGGIPWLLAHYKTRTHTKMVAFDNAGQLENCHSRDQGMKCVCLCVVCAQTTARGTHRCVCASVCTCSGLIMTPECRVV